LTTTVLGFHLFFTGMVLFVPESTDRTTVRVLMLDVPNHRPAISWGSSVATLPTKGNPFKIEGMAGVPFPSHGFPVADIGKLDPAYKTSPRVAVSLLLSGVKEFRAAAGACKLDQQQVADAVEVLVDTNQLRFCPGDDCTQPGSIVILASKEKEPVVITNLPPVSQHSTTAAHFAHYYDLRHGSLGSQPKPVPGMCAEHRPREPWWTLIAQLGQVSLGPREPGDPTCPPGQGHP
jgi:hypothetical protein